MDKIVLWLNSTKHFRRVSINHFQSFQTTPQVGQTGGFSNFFLRLSDDRPEKKMQILAQYLTAYLENSQHNTSELNITMH